MHHIRSSWIFILIYNVQEKMAMLHLSRQVTLKFGQGNSMVFLDNWYQLSKSYTGTFILLKYTTRLGKCSFTLHKRSSVAIFQRSKGRLVKWNQSTFGILITIIHIAVFTTIWRFAIHNSNPFDTSLKTVYWQTIFCPFALKKQFITARLYIVRDDG